MYFQKFLNAPNKKRLSRSKLLTKTCKKTSYSYKQRTKVVFIA